MTQETEYGPTRIFPIDAGADFHLADCVQALIQAPRSQAPPTRQPPDGISVAAPSDPWWSEPMNSQSPSHGHFSMSSAPISAPEGVTIRAVDPPDVDGLRAWNAAAREAYCTDREAVWWEDAHTAIARFADIRPGRLLRALVAEDLGGHVLGTGELAARPGHPAEVDVGVRPTHRRRGIGRALASAVEAELTTWVAASDSVTKIPPVEAEVYTEAGVTAAQRWGLVVGNREYRLLRDLPVTADELDALDRPNPRVRTFSWTGPVPDELAADWARLEIQMEEDVPLGDLTRTVPRIDVEKVRENEQRMTREGWILVRSLAQLDGASVGYTVMFLPREHPEIVVQDDTLVDRAHRGHGVGRALKLANLRQLSQLPEASDTRYIQTWTAVDNAPMLALNKTFGFRVADTMTALEGQLREC